MSFTVLTVLHRSAPELARLLPSLARFVGPHQLVVVDTGPDDGGSALAHAAGARVLPLPENPGFGPANTAGLAFAEHPVTVLLNPDVVLLDDGLARLVAAAEATDALHVPALRNADGSPQRSAHPVPGGLRELLPALLPNTLLPGNIARRAEPWRPDGRGTRPVGWAIAAALAARTSTLRELGPFDDAFLHYEDLDLCLRAGATGRPTLLHPTVVLEHTGGHSTSRSPTRLEDEARRRRAVIAARLGEGARRGDDATQALTFVSRGLRPGERGARARAQLQALREARRTAR